MKTYIVRATMFTYLTAEIQANTLDEAEEIARELDGTEFTETPHKGEWETHWTELEEKGK